MTPSATRPSPALLALPLLVLFAPLAPAGEWQQVTAELIKAENPGYGKLCGVVVDHRNGAVFINLSDKGVYYSGDAGKNWKRTSSMDIKGRTEWPGCLMLDPGGKSMKMVMALVYGEPISVSRAGGKICVCMDQKSSTAD